MFCAGITTSLPRAKAKTSIRTKMSISPRGRCTATLPLLRSWREDGDVAVFDRDTFYIRLMPPEVAQAANGRNRNGI